MGEPAAMKQQTTDNAVVLLLTLRARLTGLSLNQRQGAPTVVVGGWHHSEQHSLQSMCGIPVQAVTTCANAVSLRLQP